MIDLGLSHAELKQFKSALVNSHDARTTILVLDRDEHELHELTGQVISGSVDFDWHSDVDRSCSFEMVDTGRQFHFVPDGPSEVRPSARGTIFDRG